MTAAVIAIASLHRHAAVRLVTTCVLFALTMQAYWALNASLAPRFDFFTPLDDAIPFLPSTIVVYMSLYAMVVVAAVTADAASYVRLFAGVLVANVVCYAGFALFCAHYPRPALADIDAPWQSWFAMMFARDLPGNTFPSVHVAVATVVALEPRRFANAWRTWALLIAASTVTVKQHYVADVAGGLVVGALAFALVRRASR